MKTSEQRRNLCSSLQSFNRAVCLLCVCFALAGISMLSSCSDDDSQDGSKVAVILKNNTPYWQQVALGVKDAAKDNNLKADILFCSEDVDPTGQLADLASLNLSDYKGVIIAPSSPAPMLTAVQEVAAQLPVVVVDTPMDSSVGYRTFIGTDNPTAGAEFFSQIQSLLPPAPATIPDVVIIQVKDSPAIAQRVTGFQSTMPAGITPTIVEVTGDSEAFIAQITNALGTATSNAFIFAANGTAADCTLATLQRMSDAGKNVSDYVMIAFDVTASILNGITDDMVVATNAQDTYGMGYKAVLSILDASVPSTQYLPTKVINKNNINDEDVQPYLSGIIY